MQWQPIETALRDGSYIIAGCFKRDEFKWVKHSRWITADEISEIEGLPADEFGPGWTDGDDDSEPLYPTHWMPLPAPPKD